LGTILEKEATNQVGGPLRSARFITATTASPLSVFRRL